jgi:hypothetical protein
MYKWSRQALVLAKQFGADDGSGAVSRGDGLACDGVSKEVLA